MASTDPLSELLKLAESLGVRVRRESMHQAHDSGGGLCRFRGEVLVLLDSSAPRAEQAATLAEAIAPLVSGKEPLSLPAQQLLGLMRRRLLRWRRYGLGRQEPVRSPGLRFCRPRRPE